MSAEDEKATEIAQSAAVDVATESGSEESVIEYLGDPAADRKGTRTVRWLIPALLAALFVASAAFAGVGYFLWYRADQQVNAAASDAALKAASDGAAAILTYAPETMDKDFANAKSHLTGDFLKHYTEYTDTVVTPAVKERAVKKQAVIARAAVSEMHPDKAVVLAFINQISVSKQDPDGSFSASSVKITMVDVDGKWLISEFDPV